MSNTNAVRDGNRVPSALGASGTDTFIWKTDSVTTFALMDLAIIVAGGTLPSSVNTRDNNRVTVALGQNNVTGAVQPVLVDNANGLLAVTATIS